jgi:hypothetical protein
MTELEEHPEDNALYPEISASGSLHGALRARLGQVKELQLISNDVLPGVTVKAGERSVQIYVAKYVCRYILECWARGIAIGVAHVAEPNSVVEVISDWLLNVASIDDMKEKFPFRCTKKGQSIKDGNVVEAEWKHLEVYAAVDIRPLVSAASRHPKLRQLYPYMSLDRLSFSRVTGYPYTRDCPSAKPIILGKYRVYSTDGMVLGDGDASTALNLIVDHLPAAIGPAVAGTADER